MLCVSTQNGLIPTWPRTAKCSKIPNQMTAAPSLHDLQWMQLRHDEQFHRDVVQLPVANRLKHYALHFAKYVGNFAAANERSDKPAFDRALVDSFIIALAAANTLGMDLRQVAAAPSPEDPLDSLENSAGAAFVLALTQPVGRLAKACESLDHVEAFPFREEMQSAVAEVFRLVMAQGAFRQMNLTTSALERLDQVESRHLFRGHLTGVNQE
jgi:hypothetical protein